jgi:multicomponent Na+:H+ antiporter subunit G
LNIQDIIAIVFVGIGVLFFVFGVVGLLRFPDIYARIHAAGKASILGLVGLAIGAAIIMPEMTLKVIALTLFLVMTQPVASHAIASAAYRSGVPMADPKRDDLQGVQDTTLQQTFPSSQEPAGD